MRDLISLRQNKDEAQRKQRDLKNSPPHKFYNQSSFLHSKMCFLALSFSQLPNGFFKRFVMAFLNASRHLSFCSSNHTDRMHTI